MLKDLFIKLGFCTKDQEFKYLDMKIEEKFIEDSIVIVVTYYIKINNCLKRVQYLDFGDNNFLWREV